jgi:hypothetical protein
MAACRRRSCSCLVVRSGQRCQEPIRSGRGGTTTGRRLFVCTTEQLNERPITGEAQDRSASGGSDRDGVRSGKPIGPGSSVFETQSKSSLAASTRRSRACRASPETASRSASNSVVCAVSARKSSTCATVAIAVAPCDLRPPPPHLLRLPEIQSIESSAYASAKASTSDLAANRCEPRSV